MESLCSLSKIGLDFQFAVPEQVWYFQFMPVRNKNNLGIKSLSMLNKKLISFIPFLQTEDRSCKLIRFFTQ